MPFFIGKIRERNGDMEYDTDILLEAKMGKQDQRLDKIASTWRGKLKYDKDYGGYWCEGSLIIAHGCTPVPDDHYEILKKYMVKL